jgi:hypothetical protein
MFNDASLKQKGNRTRSDKMRRNWDDILPAENDDEFYVSVNAQIDFVRRTCPSIDTIRAITTIFRISNRTYDQVFSCYQLPATRSSPILSAKVGRPILILPEWNRDFWLIFTNSKNAVTVSAPKSAESGFRNSSRAWTTWSLWVDTGGVDSWRGMLTQRFHPDLILNMDESMFRSQPLKGAQKIVPLVAMLRSSRGLSKTKM